MAYATSSDFTSYTGQAATGDTDRQLQRASDQIDDRLIGAFYATDTTGLPTDVNQIAGLKNATCAQVEYWIATGDELGLSEQYQVMSIGSVTLNKGGKSAAIKPRDPILCPRAIGELRRAALWPVQPVVW